MKALYEKAAPSGAAFFFGGPVPVIVREVSGRARYCIVWTIAPKALGRTLMNGQFSNRRTFLMGAAAAAGAGCFASQLSGLSAFAAPAPAPERASR